MKTPYDKDNQNFSNKCHLLARDKIYALIWPKAELKFIDTSLHLGGRSQILDGEMAIDREVIVNRGGGISKYQIQERFRAPKYASFRDLTITHFNHITGKHSEWAKIAAGLFVYGYADCKENPSGFIEAICINTGILKMGVDRGQIDYKMENNGYKNQDFMCFKFDDLENLPGAVVFHYAPAKQAKKVVKIVLPKLQGVQRNGIRMMVKNLITKNSSDSGLPWELHCGGIVPDRGMGW